MSGIDDAVLGDPSDVVSVTPPGAKRAVYLRSPSFGEWHDLATAHQGLDGKPPSAELIARTLATCLSDESGKQIAATPSERKALMAGSPRRIMWLYKKCWETVLKSDEESVGEIEKNSEADAG